MATHAQMAFVGTSKVYNDVDRLLAEIQTFLRSSLHQHMSSVPTLVSLVRLSLFSAYGILAPHLVFGVFLAFPVTR
jgi:hypothetical protein